MNNKNLLNRHQHEFLSWIKKTRFPQYDKRVKLDINQYVNLVLRLGYYFDENKSDLNEMVEIHKEDWLKR